MEVPGMEVPAMVPANHDLEVNSSTAFPFMYQLDQTPQTVTP
jgi:hypothetical protein